MPEKLIERHARANSPCFAFTRACCPNRGCCWPTYRGGEREREREREGEREREREREKERERKTQSKRGRVSTTMVQQCSPTTRCTEIPIGCQIAIRLVGHCTTTDYRARIELDRTKSACALQIFQLSRGVQPKVEKFRCLIVDRSVTILSPIDNINVIFYHSFLSYFLRVILKG